MNHRTWGQGPVRFFIGFRLFQYEIGYEHYDRFLTFLIINFYFQRKLIQFNQLLRNEVVY